MLGLSAAAAAAGVALPVVHYARQPSEDVTPGEATVEPAKDQESWLSHRLRGIWEITFMGADASLTGIPLTGLELVFDVGPTGRSLRGYLGTPSALRNNTPEYRVLGDLTGTDKDDKAGKVSWRLVDNRMLSAEDQSPGYEFEALLDEAWEAWGGAGSGTLSGEVRRLDRSPALTELDFNFVAKKRPFPEARKQAPLNDELLAWLISPTHRLFHQLWHASRDKWHQLPEEKRNALRGLGWQPGEVNKERDARGDKKHLNGSGEDFLFMHRDMMLKARKLQPELKSWTQLPLPAPYVERDCQGFIDYFENHDGCSVPPAWESEDDPEYAQWLKGVKGENSFYSNYQMWESQYQDPEYLSRLTLGEFGSEMELGIHDWLHMRWATVTRDPSSNMPVPFDRNPSDFSTRWFSAENDYLGDPFSSHVSPVFWMFHGWIDDRIEDWFRAHERYHPGEVQRKTVKGVPWFTSERWVEVEEPWLGASFYGCTVGGEMGEVMYLDPEDMKLAIGIAFSGDDDVPGLMRRSPRRPWYARHMKLSS